MASNGFFLGGMAEGVQASRELGLKERTQEQDVGLRTRGLDIQEKQLKRADAQDDIKRGDDLIAQTMGHVAEVIKSGLAVGSDPMKIQQAVAPLVESAKAIASRVGRDPASLDAQVQASLTGPTGIQAATAAGTAEGTKEATKQNVAAKILTEAGADASGFILDPAKRSEAEGKLRDDYVKQGKEFVTVRDYKDRMDTAPTTGAGDIALVFSYMKVLDPGSTVREGEFATAANAAGVPSAIASMYNKIIGGGKLETNARDQLKESAEKIWQKAIERQNSLANQYSNIAKRGGMNPKNVIIDPLEAAPKTGTTPSGLKYQILGP